MTIYEILGIIAQAFPLTATPSDTFTGLQTCGTCPFNGTYFKSTNSCHRFSRTDHWSTEHYDGIVHDTTDNLNKTTDLNRRTMSGDHNTSPNESAIIPYDTFDLGDPVLVQNNKHGINVYTMTPQVLTGSLMAELPLQHQPTNKPSNADR